MAALGARRRAFGCRGLGLRLSLGLPLGFLFGLTPHPLLHADSQRPFADAATLTEINPVNTSGGCMIFQRDKLTLVRPVF